MCLRCAKQQQEGGAAWLQRGVFFKGCWKKCWSARANPQQARPALPASVAQLKAVWVSSHHSTLTGGTAAVASSPSTQACCWQESWPKCVHLHIISAEVSRKAQLQPMTWWPVSQLRHHKAKPKPPSKATTLLASKPGGVKGELMHCAQLLCKCTCLKEMQMRGNLSKGLASFIGVVRPAFTGDKANVSAGGARELACQTISVKMQISCRVEMARSKFERN